MGIRQLTTFVRQNERHLKSDVDIKNTSLVIDGYGLLAMLMRRTPLQYGGNYRDLYQVFFDFFSLLCYHHVTTYVVLDGGNNFPIKLNTWVKRKEKVISAVQNFYINGRVCYDLPKPILTRLVFIQVLKDLHIKYVFAEREADAVTAVIANKLKCFVLTNDSDFFIFNVIYGVISVDDILNMTKENSILKLYESKNLIKFLNIRTDCLVYLPVIFGCDYSDDVKLSRIQQELSINQVHSLAKKFDIVRGRLKNSRKHFIDCLSNNDANKDLIDEIGKILGEYNLENFEIESEKMLEILFAEENPKFDPNLFLASNIDEDTKLNAIKNMVHCGKIHGSVLDIYMCYVRLHGVLAENIARSSCAHLSQKLRKYLYAFLFKSYRNDVTITEYVRKGFTMKEIKISAKSPDFILPDQIDDSNRVDLIYKVLKFNDTIDETLIDHCLFILTVNYLISEARHTNLLINIDHLEVLVLMYVVLKNEVPHEAKDVDIYADLAHICCCWQGILFECILLNTLFGEPLVVPPAYHLFDGQLVHWLYMGFSRGKFPSDYLLNEEMDTYNKLLEYLLNKNADNIETTSKLRGRSAHAQSRSYLHENKGSEMSNHRSDIKRTGNHTYGERSSNCMGSRGRTDYYNYHRSRDNYNNRRFDNYNGQRAGNYQYERSGNYSGNERANYHYHNERHMNNRGNRVYGRNNSRRSRQHHQYRGSGHNRFAPLHDYEQY